VWHSCYLLYDLVPILLLTARGLLAVQRQQRSSRSSAKTHARAIHPIRGLCSHASALSTCSRCLPPHRAVDSHADGHAAARRQPPRRSYEGSTYWGDLAGGAPGRHHGGGARGSSGVTRRRRAALVLDCHGRRRLGWAPAPFQMTTPAVRVHSQCHSRTGGMAGHTRHHFARHTRTQRPPPAGGSARGQRAAGIHTRRASAAPVSRLVSRPDRLGLVL